jgi:hypothetical protein
MEKLGSAHCADHDDEAISFKVGEGPLGTPYSLCGQCQHLVDDNGNPKKSMHKIAKGNWTKAEMALAQKAYNSIKASRQGGRVSLDDMEDAMYDVVRGFELEAGYGGIKITKPSKQAKKPTKLAKKANKPKKGTPASAKAKKTSDKAISVTKAKSKSPGTKVKITTKRKLAFQGAD